MIIDIQKLPREGRAISRDFEFTAQELVEESAVFLEAVHADLEVKKAGEDVLIKGRITSRVSFVCSRCLAPFEFPIDSCFDLVFFPQEMDEIKDQLEDEDLDMLFYSGGHIDVNEVVREQLNLTFPLKPICSERCQGICPVCGKVVRRGKCACLIRTADSRLEKLKFFIRDKE